MLRGTEEIMMNESDKLTAWTSVMLVATCVAACGELDEEAVTQQAATGTCARAVPSASPAAANVVLDGDRTTHYAASATGWNTVVVDLGCKGKITGIRRFMHSPSGAAKRVGLSERYAYSNDGVTWKTILPPSAATWGSQPYGWAEWVRPGVVGARYVKFEWEADGDALTEIAIDRRIVTSSNAASNALEPYRALDEETGTGFGVLVGWNDVRIELPSPQAVVGFRRYIRAGGATREEVRVSVDGTTWKTLTAADVSGWSAYATGTSGQFGGITSSWSPWMRIRAPEPIKMIEFRWESNRESVREIELDTVEDGGDRAYDFSFTDGSHQVNDDLWPAGPFRPQGGLSIGPPRNAYDLSSVIGLTGTYEGRIYNRVNTTAPSGSVRASLTLYDDGAEIRGILRVQSSGLAYQGGICGDSEIAVGTALAVRMSPWTHDGRFTSQFGALLQPSTQERYASGTTTREVGGLFTSGRVVTTFHAGAAISELGFGTMQGGRSHTYLVGDVEIGTPGPCPNATVALSFSRLDEQLMNTFGW